MDSRLQRGFRVGEYEVRPLEGRIIGPNGSQHVQPKAMEVLLCLAEQSGELVTRRYLIERGWGDTAESAEVLTRCISELRRHLDDHPDSVRYIQTVPRRGYRLVANVELADDSAVAPKGVATDRDPAAATVSATAQDGNEPPSLIAAFWDDLKRRKVVRVSVAYFIVAWLLLQIGDVLFEALQLPDWALKLIIAIVVLGFPIAVVLAWAFQVTPEGIVLDIRGAKDGKTSLRRNLDVVIIGTLIVAVGVLGYRAFVRDSGVGDQAPSDIFAAQAPENSVAVLRFLNIGGEAHFSDGLGEELLDRLANLKELGVAARTSSWAFSDQDVDVPTIATQLDVNYVLEGSVQHVGDQIRVTAQLNDGKTGKHVWSNSYDRQLTTANFFQTQSDIARQVVSLLKISLSQESEARLSASPDTSIEALGFYLQGQEYFRKPHSDATLDTAASFFRQSLEVDPRFAMAYAGLCDTELGRYIITRDVAVFEAAERACHRALTLDDDMPRVMAALGGLYLFSGQNEKAEEQLVAAIAERPNLIDAYADLGEALENQGRLEEAEQAFLAMTTRQPGYWYSHNALGNFLYRQLRYEEAAQEWTKVTELVPDRALGYNNVGVAFYMMGNFDAASRAYELSVEIEPYVDNYTNLGLAYFYDGRYEKAAEMQLKAHELRPDDARLLGRLAVAYQHGGREDEAEPLFRDAIELIQKQLVVNPDDIRLNRFLAVYNASIGDIEKAQKAIARALELRPKSSGVRFDAAKVALAVGDTDKAIAFLKEAKDLGYSTNLIWADPYFESLHNDAWFVLIERRENEENNKGTER